MAEWSREDTSVTAIRLTAALLIAFGLAFFFYYGLNTISDPVFAIDFLPYHLAGRLVAAGDVQPLTDYARTGSFGATSGPFLDYFHRYFFPDSPTGTHWIYLPGYAWIFSPLAGLDFPLAARVWLAVNGLLSLGSIALLWSARPWRGDKQLGAWRTAWIVFFALTFQPILDNMWHGNISALIFFVFCLSYWLLRRNHPWLAGLVLGLIVPLKFYPALFVLYFAWRRNWFLVTGAVVGSAVMLGISLLTVGWAGNLAYFQMVLAEFGSGGIPAFNNQSISGFLLHAFTRGDVNAWGDIQAPPVVGIIRLALAGALICAVVWAMRRRPGETSDPVMAQDLDLGLVIGVMLLASPITWYHYYVWLLFPILVLFDALLVSPTTNTRQILLLAIGYGLVVVQGIVVIRPFATQAIQEVRLLRVLLSQAFFGAVVLMYLIWRLRLTLARRWVYGVTTLAVLAFALVGVAASAALQPAARAEQIQTSPDGKGYRFDRDGWIYVHIEGGAYERGYQHGYLVAPELAEILKNTKDLTYQDTGMEWQFFVEQAQKQFLPYLDDELLQEIKGIAAGAQKAGTGITWQHVLTWNGYEELTGYWWPNEMAKWYANYYYCVGFMVNYG